MDRLEPIDREEVEPVLGEHIDFLDTIHRQHMRLFGVGGVVIVVLAVLVPMWLQARLELRPLQVGLVAGGTLLLGLGAVRHVARLQAARLIKRVKRYCEEHDLQLARVLHAARKTHGRLFFFRALWDAPSCPAEVDKEVAN